jgi:ubiquinone/menaquinone biosynthesis C-methylase UbiE
MNPLNRLVFNFWYFTNPPWDTGISPPELLEYIRDNSSGRAIDLGCGTGTNVITLAKAGWQVTGVDFASRAIARARKKILEQNIQAKLQVGDVTQLKDNDGTFNLALDIGCFHVVANKTEYLAALMHLLEPGGRWLMYAFFKGDAQLSGPGLVDTDLNLIHARMLPLWRRDGVDKRERPSAWFLFQKP